MIINSCSNIYLEHNLGNWDECVFSITDNSDVCKRGVANNPSSLSHSDNGITALFRHEMPKQGCYYQLRTEHFFKNVLHYIKWVTDRGWFTG